MQLKPRAWYLISLLLFVAAICMWRYGNKYAAEHGVHAKSVATVQTNAIKSAHPPLIKVAATNAVAKRTNYRISNTTQNIEGLLHNNHGIILRNALIDTEIPVALDIPAHLRAKGAPGSYLVQADRPLDNDFYAELSKAGATYISYVPNDTALVKASPEQATNLAANADIIAVLPYEPYYKLDSTLLPSAVEQLPQTNELSITTFPGQRDAALAELHQLGATLIGEDRSPFGPTLIVMVPPNSLTAVAQMPLAQEIETFTPRRLMNDLTRVTMGVATNTLTNTPNYLGLTGKNVTINMNDTGVDAGHPDLTNRVLGDLTDYDGHGTHVAGIIAGSGAASGTVTNKVPGSIIPGASFRGKATNALLFVQNLNLTYGPYVSDAELQENASVNLGPTNLISNDSWGYASTSYDSHAASFDAATRDAQPDVDGEQPLLFVFSAGNNGQQASITSPGTAKNVITVGAVDSPRFITNLVSEDGFTTNQVWLYETSYSNAVAGFSSAGNVDLGVEGLYGRFKPDVVAPGVFIVSCRSHLFTDPTNEVKITDESYPAQTVQKHQTNYYFLYLPPDASGATVILSSNSISPIPFPTNMVLLGDTFYPPTDPVATNFVQTNAYNLTNFTPGQFWFLGVTCLSNQTGPIDYNVDIYLYETNQLGDYFEQLADLDDALLPNYRYETGTSMSAGAVSGVLALMQEYLQTKTSITNPSPALLKAMLINGSRTLSSQYDFDVNTPGANEQGWGMPFITNSIPISVTNGLGSGNASLLLIDQSPSNALATGQYQSYQINCTDTNASTLYPLRVTLVWTDPPGNPAAGVALVNNLDLTVVDKTGTNIFIGNNFQSGDIFTEDSNPTNLPAGESGNTTENIYVDNGVPTFTSAGDSINNVQNVYISPATNGSIQFPLTVTISGTRVNVNAIPGQTTNICQDYALVISSDDPVLSAPLTIQSKSSGNLAPVLITVVSNGIPSLHQRVGANEPNLYTNPISTNGDFSQWHFFVFTNNQFTNGQKATNVAFATFLPPNLSIPRQSGSADIDMYVSTDSALTNLTPSVVQAADKSLSRGGTESIIYSNSFANEVYYIGIKSEDQQASDFGFYGIAQQQPFSTVNSDGSISATGTELPVFIPNSLSPTPALVFAFLVNPNPLEQYIRRVTVDLGVQVPSSGILFGAIQFDGMETILNNYGASSSSGFTNTFDDLQEDPNSGDITTPGPTSLTQYQGQTMNGLWLLAEANDDQYLTGNVTQYTVNVDPQPPVTGFFITLNPNEWFDDYVLVPNDATNLIISALYEGTNGAGGPIGIYLTNEPGPLTLSDYGVSNVQPPGGFLSLSTNFPVTNWPGSPALSGGTWYFGLYNQSSSASVTLYVQVQIQQSDTPNLVQSYTNSLYTPLLTDAHTQSTICFTNQYTNNQQVVSLNVGVRINDTNLDDLVLHLTSPQGTSVLLFEDRGGPGATNLGLTLTNNTNDFVYTVFTEDTNLTTIPIKFAVPPYAQEVDVPPALLWSNSWETVTNGVYTNNTNAPVRLEGWLVTNDVVTVETPDGTNLVTNNEVGIVTDPTGDQYITLTNVPTTNTLVTNSLGSNYLALTSGRIVQTFGATNYPLSITNGFAITKGQPYQLVFYAKPLGITHWWPGNGNPDDIIGTNNGVLTNGAGYGQGEVGQAFLFDQSVSNQYFYVTNNTNFATPGLTTEEWVNFSRYPTNLPPANSNSVQTLVAKPYAPVSPDIFDSYTVWVQNGVLNGSIYSTGGQQPYVSYIWTNSLDSWHHVAYTFDNTTSIQSLYLDGVRVASNTVAGPILYDSSPFQIGADIENGKPDYLLSGSIDEASLYDRALSPAEIYAIYHAGTLGKYSTNSLLPNFTLTFDGISTNNIVLTNPSGGWQLFTNSFTANSNQVTVEFQGNALGVLLDSIQLIQVATTNFNNYYLPEETMAPFVGEDPEGCWTLDVWDTRNDSPSATDGELLSWSLQITTSSTNAVLDVLTNGVGVTNTITNGTIAYYAIDVPDYATFATNLLTCSNGGPVTLLFNQSQLPTGGLPGDVVLAPAVNAGQSSTNILATEGLPPPLLPGQRYFLGVETTGGTATYTLQVTFNGSTNVITPLNIPYTNIALGITNTNTFGTNAIVGTNNLGAPGTNGPQYYSFVAPTNAVMVTFQLINLTTNAEVDLYAREGLPLPGPDSFDFASRNAGTNDQFIVVTTNSVPVSLPVASTNDLLPLSPSVWYLAVYNFPQTTNINYLITATVLTSNELSSDIIPLTNAVPYINTASPGYPNDLLYSFAVSNSPAGITFTVANQSGFGNVELLANLDDYPTPQDATFGSYNNGTADQTIQVVPNAALPNLNGTWYLAVPNTTNTNVSYSITAVTNVIVAPPLKPLTWSGAYSGYWDILTTSNWWITGTTTPYPYQDNSPVTFDDSATGTTTVSLRSALAPTSVTVNNAAKTYTFTGPGGVASGSLTKENSGTLIIDNANSFSSVTFSAGTLQLGNNDATGSLVGGSLLPTGTFADPGSLIFDRSDSPPAVSAAITGGGSVAQTGRGTLILSGNSSYNGSTSISSGTLEVASTNALGAWTGGGVTVANGGTLDLGGLPAEGVSNSLFGGKQFTISGTGVGGNGAIVNNGPNPLLGGLENIVLSSNATVGGVSRWDLRNTAGASSLNLGGYTLTKTGSNQINLASTVIPAGNIVIEQGILSLEANPQLTGGVVITADSGGFLGESNIAQGAFTHPGVVVLSGGGITNLTGGGVSYIDTPIVVAANSSLGNGAGTAVFDGVITGGSTLTNLGAGVNILTANNIYTGATVVAQGTLALSNNGAIANSATVTLDPAATIDVSGRTDQTFTVVSNQTFFGGGTVNGNLTIDQGAVFSPGTANAQVGVLTVTGNTILAGTEYMEISSILPATNDVLTAGSVEYGGTLIVSSVDTSTNAFAAGDSYTLFNTPASSSAFSSTNLPPLPGGLAWTNTFGTSGPGQIIVYSPGAVQTQAPTFSQFSVGPNGTVVLSSTNGTPGALVSLLTTTNTALPFSNWTVISTGSYNNQGDITITASPTNNPQFYILRSP